MTEPGEIERLHDSLTSTVQIEALKYNISPVLLDSLLFRESGFDPDVVFGNKTSSAGALGVAQFMPATAASLGINPLNPEEAISGAAMYLRQLIDRYDGDIGLGLAAYNWGPGNVDRALAESAEDGDSVYTKIPAETRRYITEIGHDVRRTFLPDIAAIGDTLPKPFEGNVGDFIRMTAGETPAGQAIGNVVETITSVPRFLEYITDPQRIRRVVLTFVAGVMILLGLVLYVFASSPGARKGLTAVNPVAGIAAEAAG